MKTKHEREKPSEKRRLSVVPFLCGKTFLLLTGSRKSYQPNVSLYEKAQFPVCFRDQTSYREIEEVTILNKIKNYASAFDKMLESTDLSFAPISTRRRPDDFDVE